MGTGMTFDEYAELKLKPRAGADSVFFQAAEQERDGMFPMPLVSVASHLRSRGYDCRPQSLDLLLESGVVSPAGSNAWSQADVMGPENFSDGYTTPNLDLNLRSVIGEVWQGRGPCMVLNDVSIADEHFPEDVDIVAMSTVLHELAHILDRPSLVDLQSLPSEDRIEFETLVISNAARHEHRPLPTPYFGHEEQFIRIALHLQFRAALVGVATIPNLLCAGRRYGLSHAHRYMEAIDDEPAAMTDMMFQDIVRAPPPAAFTNLWLSDVRRNLESCPQTLNGVLS